VFSADIASGRLRAVWVPLETGWAYRRFLRAFRPSYGLVMEIEIWPQMIASARSARVPLLMCNAQYPSRSLARDQSRLPIRQALMRGFSGAIVKSELQRQRFSSIGLTNLAVTGELRFEQPVPTELLAAGVAARRWLGAASRWVLTIASAVEGEDQLYLELILQLQASQRQRGLEPPLVVYVPRRPERFGLVAATLADAGLKVLRRSSLGESFDPHHWGTAPHPAPEVLLGDSLGEMYAYLAMADQVIVGGGFTLAGAHNISEALVLGKPVLTGPYVHTIEYPFLEAEAAGVARSVPDGPALSRALLEGFSPTTAAIAAFLRDHAGATQRTLDALPELLSRSAAPPRR
jgi:3-deoxy-D-manno-octulosonic-acid transferase